MIFIVLPVYNEEGSIGLLIQKIKEVMERLSITFEIVIVNDGSKDKTREVIVSYRETIPVIMIDNFETKGYGGALRDGLKKACELCKPDDIIITMDGDNTHDPFYIKDILTKIDDGYDLVVASRYLDGSKEVGLAFYRRILSRAASLLIRIFFHIGGIKDYTSGFRGYRAAVLIKAFTICQDRFIEETGFGSSAEILIKLHSLKAKMAEVPFVLRYDWKKGRSKMNIPLTISQYPALLIRNLFRR